MRSAEKPDFYDFDGIRLFTVDTDIEILASGKVVSPSKKHRQFLFSLVRNHPRTVNYRELLREIWQSENLDEFSLKKIQETKRTLVRWLQRNGIENPSIVGEGGYRLDCVVVSGYFDADENETDWEGNVAKQIDESEETTDFAYSSTTRRDVSWREILSEQVAYVAPVGAFYGALFLIAAILESAYEFDVYGSRAVWWEAGLMLLNGAAFWSASAIIAYRSYFNKRTLLPAIGILIAAALISVWQSAQFLPFRPITQTAYQTQPAVIAFGKNVFVYFLPLAVFFLLLPFYSVIAERLVKRKFIEKMPTDAIIISPRWLLLIGAVAAPVTMISMNYMLDQANADSEYHALFVGMLMLRFVICFGLMFATLGWYYTQLRATVEPL